MSRYSKDRGQPLERGWCRRITYSAEVTTLGAGRDIPSRSVRRAQAATVSNGHPATELPFFPSGLARQRRQTKLEKRGEIIFWLLPRVALVPRSTLGYFLIVLSGLQFGSLRSQFIQRDLRATSGRQFIDPIDTNITFMYLAHKPYGAIFFACTKVSRLTRQSQTGSA